ncbi:MAG: hypothetical protein HYU39_04005 [Thaumarchaeota archaeon]|nr:hypothetical protein [Nitrososphaerota archaeon]
MSDAAPLIQLALSHHLHILPSIYDMIIPEGVFEETQHYRDLSDAMEIAKAAMTWLKVGVVQNRKEVKYLMKQKLGKGEAEAIVLCREIRAHALLTSDKYAASKAEAFGLRTMNIADVVREAHNAKIMTTQDILSLLDTLVNQSILDTQYIRQLREEAERWPYRK